MGKKIFTTLVVGVLLGLSLWVIVGAGSVVLAEGSDVNSYQLLATFNAALRLVSREYVEEMPFDELIYGAIQGMLATLDPHSMLMDPHLYDDLRLETTGKFGGLGMQVQITTEDKTLTVMAPFDDTPASRAGLMPGDKILEIDGKSTYEMDINEAVAMMRGEPGTEVTLSIYRPGMDDVMNITLVREEIKVDSVPDHFMVDDATGYIRISDFSDDTAEELTSAIQDLTAEGMRVLLLDLRSNPGGTLEAAIEVSQIFSKPGDLVVYTEGRNAVETHTEYRAAGNGFRTDVPVALLVDSGSASASEIVTGALRAWNRALVFGTTTFGKGSVQSIFNLSKLQPGAPDDMAIKLTIARYFTPDGVCIDGVGIDPDVYLEPVIYTGFTAHFVGSGYHRALATEFRLKHEIDPEGTFASLTDEELTGLVTAFMDAQAKPFEWVPAELTPEVLDQLRLYTRSEIIAQIGGVDGRANAARFRASRDSWIAEVGRLMNDETALAQARTATVVKLAELAAEE
ncbi:MAG TPA: S41 family peptidase [bacterium]|nr:S41 family peptidase [bacterium]